MNTEAEPSSQSVINGLREEVRRLRGIQKRDDKILEEFKTDIEAKDATIASQRATIAKLRKELERVRDQCHEHWQNLQIASQSLHTEIELTRTWREAHQQIANAIGKGR